MSGSRLRPLGITLPRGEAHRLERVLAMVRALLAVCALLALHVDPLSSVRADTAANLLLIGYVVYSLLVLLALRLAREVSPKLTWALHGTDVLWAAGIGLLTGGPEALFFGFYLFVLVAAAYRWGLSECMLTISVIIVLLLGETWVGSLGWIGVAHVTLNRVIVRSAYLLILGVLVGQIAEQNRRLREEPLAIARLIRRARVESGLRGTLHGVMSELLRILPARRLLIPVWETSRDRLFLWAGELRAGVSDLQLELLPVDAAQRPVYFPAGAPHSFHVTWRTGEAPESIGLDADGQRLDEVPGFSFPPDFYGAQPFRSVASVAFSFAGEWDARIYLVDPRFGAERERDLRFLQTLVRELNPAIYNVYLLRTLRQRAGAMERARVARELHDGAIQSLISVEMQMDVLRRRCETLAPEQRETEMRRLQAVVHNQVLELRELMQQMKPVEVDPRQVPDFLADLVERFRHDSGIEARFVSDVDDLNVPPRVARELARIVQEALTNIRRHSGARNAVVQFAHADGGGWKLVVDDDGRGFDFNGSLDLGELDRTRKGPLVIKERVRSIGAEMKIESVPGRGSRLEIHMARKAHAAHR